MIMSGGNVEVDVLERIPFTRILRGWSAAKFLSLGL